ncbi:4Fe-4S binding protein [Desulfurella amilsii]
MDFNKCIGCKACMEVCPMHARNFSDLNKTNSLVS